MPPAADQGRLRFMVRALAHRNYRLFFAGQGTSLVGTWITRVATSWLVYRLTGSAAILGIVGFAGQIPTFVLAPVAGVWVDRTSRYRVLVATQVLSMLQSFALGWLALAGVINVRHVLLLGAFQGVINAFDTPARQSFVVDMVEDRRDLPNAIALNSSMVNGARLIGPSVAGILIATTGEAWCFMLDGFSYLAVIASLRQIRQPGFYDELTQKAERLYSGLSGLLEAKGIPARVQGLGARFGIYFGFRHEVWNYQDAARIDGELGYRFIRACFEQGVYFHNYGKLALGHHGFSAAHKAADIEETLNRVEDALKTM
jgi:MFS family permease